MKSKYLALKIIVFTLYPIFSSQGFVIKHPGGCCFYTVIFNWNKLQSLLFFFFFNIVSFDLFIYKREDKNIYLREILSDWMRYSKWKCLLKFLLNHQLVQYISYTFFNFHWTWIYFILFIFIFLMLGKRNCTYCLKEVRK